MKCVKVHFCVEFFWTLSAELCFQGLKRLVIVVDYFLSNSWDQFWVTFVDHFLSNIVGQFFNNFCGSIFE